MTPLGDRSRNDIGYSISAARAIRAALIRSGKRLKMTAASAGESYS
jgi:hypothetical protein